MPKVQHSEEDAARLRASTHSEPHRFLGAHPIGAEHAVVRAYHPDATGCRLRVGKATSAMTPLGDGLFYVNKARAVPFPYELIFSFADGTTWTTDDPYRFLATVGPVDEHLLGEGRHRRLWEILGAHVREWQGVPGVSFALWAPNAQRVSVVGDFCNWDGRLYPMRRLGSSGIFELFIPRLTAGTLYKYEILTAQGTVILKADPMAQATEIPPDTASRVTHNYYHWQDTAWREQLRTLDIARRPLAVYEVHLGSWARVPEEHNRPLSYREIAPRLVSHVKRLGFNAIELLPVAEHPFTGSWGYQVTGYYAPTARYGEPDDLRYFVDVCHQAGIAVIVDWVPAHFPKDAFALAQFDGTALYEHPDPRRGEHPDWGTLIFNYGRNEVRNFLVANALYWLETFHVDGLRVDAVASLLYLDYSRKAGEWLPNAEGGRENLEAVAFLRELADAVHTSQPGCWLIAEESTAWPGVTHSTGMGGLGFDFKWNMGWMHDSLKYFSLDPIHRKYHQDDLTFAMVYEHSERFIMPLSHDEVVHGKGSLLRKMAGDTWQQFANLRLLFTYQMTRPGKKLLFMGSELASLKEWDHDTSLDWHLQDDPMRRALGTYLHDLLTVYKEAPCLWRGDPDADGFFWIDHADHEQSVLVYGRRFGDEHMLIVLNLTPVPRDNYRIGAPAPGLYVNRLCSDSATYGGSDHAKFVDVATEPLPWHSQPQSIVLTLPPLGALLLSPGA